MYVHKWQRVRIKQWHARCTPYCTELREGKQREGDFDSELVTVKHTKKASWQLMCKLLGSVYNI